MSQAGIVYLTYHELQMPGHPLCLPGEAYERFVVQESEFRHQLARLQSSGFRAMNVTEALRSSGQGEREVVITFDDGCESDLLGAAPALKEAGFGAAFYVVVDWLGRRGWLSKARLRELSEAGFEVGCHSKTHAYLTDLSPDGLQEEIVKAKDQLEQIVGKRVDHLSCPGGRWNRRVAQVAREAGYLSVATSRIGTNSPTKDAFCLKRVGVVRGTTLAEFDRACRGEGLFLRRARYAVLAAAKHMLGNALYDKIWSAVLNR
jgi:peptidoglycan/xylan/chitin deacetylase (PgdA/CDA1 family)